MALVAGAWVEIKLIDAKKQVRRLRERNSSARVGRGIDAPGIKRQGRVRDKMPPVKVNASCAEKLIEHIVHAVGDVDSLGEIVLTADCGPTPPRTITICFVGDEIAIRENHLLDES